MKCWIVDVWRNRCCVVGWVENIGNVVWFFWCVCGLFVSIGVC